MKYLIKGKLYNPVKVGDPGDWHQDPKDTCHDCGETPGHYHHKGCDMERCPCCGGQLISCSCGAIYKVDEKMSKEEIERLKKLQPIQTDADNSEIKNYLSKERIEYDSEGPSGNIFFILAETKRVLEKKGLKDKYEEMEKRVFSSKSYEEALSIINEYVHLQNTRKKKEMVLE